MEEARQLRAELLARNIDLDVAKARTLVGARSAKAVWKSKAWRERREQLLAAECTVCGTNEPPLTLQHLWHPTKFTFLVAKHHPAPTPPWVNRKPKIVSEQPSCPKCGGLTMRYRKGTRDYTCLTVSHYAQCGHVFAVPVLQVAVDRKANAKRDEAAHAQFHRLLEAWKMELRDPPEAVLRAALLDSLAETIRYLECVDTCTMCRSCAYRWDKLNYRGRCSTCGKVAPTSMCFECDPQYVRCSVCEKAWHKSDRPTCWNCRESDERH